MAVGEVEAGRTEEIEIASVIGFDSVRLRRLPDRVLRGAGEPGPVARARLPLAPRRLAAHGVTPLSRALASSISAVSPTGTSRPAH